MGRLTKEERALRDAVKGGAESEFCTAMRRMEKAAEEMCVRMRTTVAHSRTHRRRAAFIRWAHDCGLSVGVATIAVRDDSNPEKRNDA